MFKAVCAGAKIQGLILIPNACNGEAATAPRIYLG